MTVTDPDTWFWRITGVVGGGHVTYAAGQLTKEGPFTNPARMIEGIMGANPAHEVENGGLLDGRSESEFQAAVWAHAGWWDQKRGRVAADTPKETG